MAAPSRRTAPLPRGWRSRIRPRILRRDSHVCQWPTEGGICGRPATDVDHITPVHLGGSDEDANLQALCSWHHTRKTGREAAAAAQAKRIPRRRPDEQHPGLSFPPSGL